MSGSLYGRTPGLEDQTRGSEEVASRDENPPRRQRVARLSRLAVALIGLTVVLLPLAVWVAFREEPKDIVGQLPLGADDNVPSVSLILAAGAAAAAFFVGLAALHAAAAMRVLARDRRIPQSLSPEMRKLRARAVDAAGPVDGSAGRRAGASAEQAAGERGMLRGAVAADGAGAGVQRGAHDRGDAGVVVAPDQAARTGWWSWPTTARDDTADLAREHGADVFTTVGNTEKKAGALNQALSEMFRDIDARDVAMVMDADSVIVPGVPRDGDGAARGRP